MGSVDHLILFLSLMRLITDKLVNCIIIYIEQILHFYYGQERFIYRKY
jgi:hypothetical protein